MKPISNALVSSYISHKQCRAFFASGWSIVLISVSRSADDWAENGGKAEGRDMRFAISLNTHVTA